MTAPIVVTRAIHPQAIALLRQLAPVKVWPRREPITRDALIEWLSDAQACLCMLTDRIDADLLSTSPSLRIISNMAVGYDNIDLMAAHQHGIMVTNTPSVLTEATAELTWALILALARQIVPARQALLEGQWSGWQPDGFLGTELSGKTLGIVGFGRIGQAVARRAAVFGVQPIALLRDTPKAPSSVPRIPRDEFLQQSDIISLHCPLTDETYHLVDQQWLSHMKPKSLLINTARGALVDEEALGQALEAGTIEGAALDVFHSEPIDGHHRLASHPRVLATPHIGSATKETRKAMALRAAQNIVDALSGNRPKDLLTVGP